VHFSISEVGGRVTYVLNVGDRQVLQSAGNDGAAGTFTVPYLGDGARTVSVEADIWAPDKRKKVKRKLDYLGSAPPVTAPPATASPAAAALEEEAPTSAPSSPEAIEGSPPVPAVTPGASPQPPSSPLPRSSAERRPIEPLRKAAHGGKEGRRANPPSERRARAANPDRIRSSHRHHRARGLSDINDSGRMYHPKTSAPRSVVLDSSGARLGDLGEGRHSAFLVLALLGLAALALAATALLRRRRLASRAARG
jgi:hypothetical protein